jgi:hypothetical protein
MPSPTERNRTWRRPSLATVISLIALVFAMSGTAVAATGGNFILGKSNTATSTTSLTNSKGTALKLSSSATTPPLAVSNSVQVPNLNASQLGGQPASAFLGANATAANSNQLGGIPASGFIQGGGTINAGRGSATGSSGDVAVLSAPGNTLYGACDSGGAGSGTRLTIYGSGQAFWFNKDGGGQADLSQGGHYAFLTPGNGSTTPYVVVLQVDTGSNIDTYTATERYNSSTDTCYWSAQVVTTNG